MSNYLIQGETLTAIADAIRAKTEGVDLMTPDAMAAAIAALETGGGLPEGLIAVDCGSCWVSSSSNATINHNLGVIPDFAFVVRYTNLNSSMAFPNFIAYTIFRKQYDVSTVTYYGGYIGRYITSSGGTSNTGANLSSTSSKEYLTDTTFTFVRSSTNSAAGDSNYYKWVCGAFVGGAN